MYFSGNAKNDYLNLATWAKVKQIKGKLGPIICEVFKTKALGIS